MLLTATAILAATFAACTAIMFAASAASNWATNRTHRMPSARKVRRTAAARKANALRNARPAWCRNA